MGEEVCITGTEHWETIECSTLDINGAAIIEQDIQASRTTITGSAVVGGDVETETLSVSGSLRISGQLQAKDATISGFVHTDGDTTIDKLVSSGEVDLSNLHSGRVVGGGVFIENISADRFSLGKESDSLGE